MFLCVMCLSKKVPSVIFYHFVSIGNNVYDKCNLCYKCVLSLETLKETGFHQSMRACLEQIRDAMLHHRWQEAAEYMPCYSQMLEDTSHSTAQQSKEVDLVCFCIMQTGIETLFLL